MCTTRAPPCCLRPQQPCRHEHSKFVGLLCYISHVYANLCQHALVSDLTAAHACISSFGRLVVSAMHMFVQRGITGACCPCEQFTRLFVCGRSATRSIARRVMGTHLLMSHLMTPMKTDSWPVPDRRVTLRDMGKMTRSCRADRAEQGGSYESSAQAMQTECRAARCDHHSTSQRGCNGGMTAGADTHSRT